MTNKLILHNARKAVRRILTVGLVLLTTITMLTSGGTQVFAYEFDYEFNPNDPNVSLVKTFTNVRHETQRLADEVVYFGYENYPNGSGTNGYGFEVAINSQGYIIEKNVNVAMPENGFIVSGHGVNSTALQTLELGDIVFYDEVRAEIKVYRHALYSLLAGCYFNYEAALGYFNFAKNNLYDFDVEGTQAILNDIENRLQTMASYDDGTPLTTQEMVQLTLNKTKIADLTNEVQYRTLPFRKVEAVAMWHRPTVANLSYAGTIAFLDHIKQAGVNVLLVETLWNSYPIYESEVAETQPLMKITGTDVFGPEYGNDYLLCLITEAHKRGIEVHAWSQTMRGGTSDTGSINDIPSHLNPEWIQRNYQGGLTFDGPMMYLDPANPEVVEHLKAIYREMVLKYDWDGIELDYIRYPYSNLPTYISNSSTTDLKDGGYTTYAMNEFLASIGRTGANLRELIKTNSDIRRQWTEYRASKITDMVDVLAKLIRELKPDLDISMAVAASHTEAKTNYMQDWMSWVQNGWIDTYRPMAYLGSVEQIEHFAKQYVALANQLSALEMGLGSAYEGFPAIINQLQMEVTYVNKGIGSAIFASQQIFSIGTASKAVQESFKAMKLHTARYEKISPYDHIKTIVDGSMDYLLDKIDRLYAPAGNFDNKETLKTIINNVKKVELKSPSDYPALEEALLNLRGYNSQTPNETIKTRINEDLDYLLNLIDLRINRALINHGYWNGKGERPDISTFEFPEFGRVTTTPGGESNGKGFFSFLNCNKSDIATVTGILGTLTLLFLVVRRKRYEKNSISAA
jgi:uncharacterized lipoprotein YddW (UPF0748 family)